jgi:hypothetical protein
MTFVLFLQIIKFYKHEIFKKVFSKEVEHLKYVYLNILMPQRHIYSAKNKIQKIRNLRKGTLKRGRAFKICLFKYLCDSTTFVLFLQIKKLYKHEIFKKVLPKEVELLKYGF